MEYVIGLALALAVCLFALLSGFDRSRAFYPTMVLVVASFYILFAVMANSRSALLWECLVAAAFFVLAVIGFKKSLWVIAVALAGHGLFDFLLHRLIQNPGVPLWWPGFCGAFDVLAGAFLATLLVRRPGSASAP